MLSSFFLIGLFFIPLLPRLAQEGAERFLGRPTFESTIRLLVKFNSWLYPSLELQQNIYSKSFGLLSLSDWLLIFSVIFLSIILSVFFIFGVIQLSNLRRNIFTNRKNIIISLQNYFFINDKIIFLLLWLGVPLLSEFMISVLHPTARIFGPIRYVLFSFPPYLILVSFGLTRLRKKYLSIALVSILVASILPLNAYYSNPTKEQWRETVDYVKNNIKPNEVILFNSPYTALPFWYYYGDADNIFGVYNATQAKELSEGKKGVWLILSFDKYTDPEGTIKSSLDKLFPNSQEHILFDIKIIYYPSS